VVALEGPAERLLGVVAHPAAHRGDAIVCVYVAEDAEAVAEHARLSGFPCAGLRQVRTVIDPVTAEG
jgi:hypothetical protein